jgi:hypothetical protein
MSPKITFLIVALFNCSVSRSQLTYNSLTAISDRLQESYTQDPAPYLLLVSGLQDKGYYLLSNKETINTTATSQLKFVIRELSFVQLKDPVKPVIEIVSTFTTENGQNPSTNIRVSFFTNDTTQFKKWLAAIKADPKCTNPKSYPFTTRYQYTDPDVTTVINAGIVFHRQSDTAATASTPATGNQSALGGSCISADIPFRFHIDMTTSRPPVPKN